MTPLIEHVCAIQDIGSGEPCRLFHGRGQRFYGLENINVDWYPPVLVITTYRDAELPHDLVDRLLANGVGRVVESAIWQRRGKGVAASVRLWGEEISSVVVKEGTLSFEVHPGVNQNTGLFLDTRPLREWLHANSEGKNLLNLFAYTCSLSVAALAGGARQVVNVDMSKPSIRWGLRNHLLNGQEVSRVRSIPHNIFTSWGRIAQFGRYDLIIIDPPSRQKGSFDVEKNYPTILKRLSKLAAEDAEVIATVNSPFLENAFLTGLFSAYAPEFAFVEFMSVAEAFRDKFPERGLKIARFRKKSNQPID